jgi:hypothetical protein
VFGLGFLFIRGDDHQESSVRVEIIAYTQSVNFVHSLEEIIVTIDTSRVGFISITAAMKNISFNTFGAVVS